MALALGACAGGPRSVSIPTVRDPRLAASQATQNGEWAQAAHYWQLVFEESEHEDLEACLESAIASQHLGALDDAINTIRCGLEEDGANPDLLALKGDVLVGLGFRRSAESCYERCLELEPDRIDVLCSLGHLRLSLDREQAAVVPLQLALDLGCDKLSTREHLAQAYRESGEPVRAWGLYVSRMDLEPLASSEFVLEAANLALNPKVSLAHPDSKALALLWLESSLSLEPGRTKLQFQRGVILEALCDEQAAVDSYRRAIEADPDFLPALTNLALLYADLGHEGPCREMVARSIAIEWNRGRRVALQQLLEQFE